MSREDRDYPRVIRDECHSRPMLTTNLWGSFQWYLKERGLSPELARENGWYPSHYAGDHEPRIVIPATSGNLRNMFWQARSMNGAVPRYQSPLAARGDALVITYPVKEVRRYCVVEGPLDALAASETGFVGIALLGGQPSAEVLAHAQQRVLRGKVILVGDNDSPTLMASLVGMFPGARFLLPTPYKDLADMPLGERRKLLG